MNNQFPMIALWSDDGGKSVMWGNPNDDFGGPYNGRVSARVIRDVFELAEMRSLSDDSGFTLIAVPFVVCAAGPQLLHALGLIYQDWAERASDDLEGENSEAVLIGNTVEATLNLVRAGGAA